jgi:hypothetical protein
MNIRQIKMVALAQLHSDTHHIMDIAATHQLVVLR